MGLFIRYQLLCLPDRILGGFYTLPRLGNLGENVVHFYRSTRPLQQPTLTLVANQLLEWSLYRVCMCQTE